MRWLALVACGVIGCGSKSSSTATVPASVLDGKGDTDPNPPSNVNTEAKPASQPGGSTAGGARLSATDACARFAMLKKQKCEWAERFPPEMGSRDVCLETLENWFSPSTPDHLTIEKTVACWSLDCEAAATCMMRLQGGASPAPTK
jgi:hypothetical protein